MNYAITSFEDKINIISLSWEFWQSNLDKLESIFKPLVEDNRALIINLWEVDYVNSLIIWFFMNISKNKKELAFWTISSEIEDIFENIWISNVIKIFYSEREAINYLINKNE